MMKQCLFFVLREGSVSCGSAMQLSRVLAGVYNVRGSGLVTNQTQCIVVPHPHETVSSDEIRMREKELDFLLLDSAVVLGSGY